MLGSSSRSAVSEPPSTSGNVGEDRGGSTVDRREALKKLAVGGATAAGLTAVMTSTSFADGGTVSCQPTLPSSLPVTLTPSVAGGKKDAVSLASSIAGVANATCPTCTPPTAPTQTVQYRWTVDSPAGFGIYTAPTGGTRIDTGFGSLTTPVWVRLIAGGNIGSSTPITTRLTARWICTNGARTAWACRHWTVTFVFLTSGGNDGELGPAGSPIITQASGNGNSSACDTPTP